jgi:exodeoxyribonuclease VII, large subunit
MSVSSAVEAPLMGRDVYTVSRLNREVHTVLEGSFALLWIEGELSNLARPSSGHLYFSLKDQAAQVRCAMFRMRNMHLGFVPENGLQVLVRARVGLYEPRGEFQLLVEYMEPAGDGALRRAFEALKQRLQREGLFDASRKRAFPRLPPRRIGVITSPTGAAIRDILSVLRRRFPAILVLIYPVQVQGEGASASIAAALRLASERCECDVLILARGGGSLEDLWAFNEEVVARAIDECELPVVTGVGHETDFTIADFVADQRAPTPSAAAELLSPDQSEWLCHIARLEERLVRSVVGRLKQVGERLKWLKKRLEQQHPSQRLRNHAQRLDELEQRLANAQRALLRHAAVRLSAQQARLERHVPLQHIKRLEAQREHLSARLCAAARMKLERAMGQLQSLAWTLDAVSPLATFARGYAIVLRLPEQTVVRRAREVAPGDWIEARLSEGRLLCRVERTESK